MLPTIDLLYKINNVCMYVYPSIISNPTKCDITPVIKRNSEIMLEVLLVKSVLITRGGAIGWSGGTAKTFK